MAALLRVQEFPERGRPALHRDGHAEGHHQEDRPRRVLEPALGRHHRDPDRRRRSADCGGGDRRHEGSGHRLAQRHGDPVRRSRRAADGPHRPTASAACSFAKATKSSRMEVVSDDGTLLTVCENGYGKRTEVERIPPPVARRHRPQERPDQRAQRPRRRHRLRHRPRRAAARDRAGPDHPHEGRRPAADRPRHAGREADGSGRRRSARLDRDAAASRRTEPAKPETPERRARAGALSPPGRRTPCEPRPRLTPAPAPRIAPAASSSRPRRT